MPGASLLISAAGSVWFPPTALAFKVWRAWQCHLMRLLYPKTHWPALRVRPGLTQNHRPTLDLGKHWQGGSRSLWALAAPLALSPGGHLTPHPHVVMPQQLAQALRALSPPQSKDQGAEHDCSRQYRLKRPVPNAVPPPDPLLGFPLTGNDMRIQEAKCSGEGVTIGLDPDHINPVLFLPREIHWETGLVNGLQERTARGRKRGGRAALAVPTLCTCELSLCSSFKKDL